jgi:hypothetical protein
LQAQPVRGVGRDGPVNRRSKPAARGAGVGSVYEQSRPGHACGVGIERNFPVRSVGASGAIPANFDYSE